MLLGRQPRRRKRLHISPSQGDPLDDVAGDLLLGTVVEVGRPRVRVPQQVLHLLPRHLLLEQVRRRRRPERVAAERPLGQPRTPQPLDDPQQVVARQAPLGQLPPLAFGGPEQGGLIGPALQARRSEVELDLELEVVPGRDLVQLAALLAEVERPGRPSVT